MQNQAFDKDWFKTKYLCKWKNVFLCQVLFDFWIEGNTF